MKHSEIQAAKPLLLYYCFLNLAKCFILFKEKTPLPSNSHHGIIADSKNEKIKVKRGHDGNIFKLFSKALLNDDEQYEQEIAASDFLSQILPGHRIYCQSQGLRFKEKFISIDEIHIRQDEQNKQNGTIWLLARAARHDFDRVGHKIGDFADSLNYKKIRWENVNEQNTGYEKDQVFAQTLLTKPYNRYPSFALNDLCRNATRRLWHTVTSYPPYRKYYIYIPRNGERNGKKLLHEMVSIYLATFYFGSITRYNPYKFNALLKNEMGPFIHEFFESQPSQFLYLMASEFMEQEVTGAALI